MFAFLAVLALGEGSAAPAIRYTVTDRVTADDGVHDQLKNALSQLGALAYKQHADDSAQMFEHFDSSSDGNLNRDEVECMLKDAVVGSDGAREIWAENLIHSFDVQVPYDDAISMAEFQAVLGSVGWLETGKGCRLLNGAYTGFCPAIPHSYGLSSECDCRDAQWPKIKTPPGGVRNVDLFESDCHDIEAWKICAEVETTRLAKDPAAAKTAKHPCEFCDNKELCSITEALVVLSAPHFAGRPVLIHPKMASLMMDVDDVAGKCGVAVDVISAYDSGWSGRKYAENGRAVAFFLQMSEPVEDGEQEHEAGNIIARQFEIKKLVEGNCNGGLVGGDICKRFPQAKCFIDAVKALPGLQFSKQTGFENTIEMPPVTEQDDAMEAHAKVAEASHAYSCAKNVFKVGQLNSAFVEKNRQADPAGLNEECVIAAQTADFYGGAMIESYEVFNTGLEGRVVDEDPARECEYANMFAGTTEPVAPLMDSCDVATCCGRPPATGPPGCGEEGMPTKSLSRHFKTHEFMSMQRAKDQKNMNVFKLGGEVVKRNRFFRADSTLLTCLDLVADKAATDLFKDDAEGTTRKLHIVEGFWTMSQAIANGEAQSRHRAGTAVRFSYSLKEGEKLETARLITLSGFVISECETFMGTTGLSMGVGLQSDSVYIDVQARGEKLFIPFATDSAALSSTDFARWIDKGRYVFNEKCVRPPQASLRQSAEFEYTYRREERRRDRRGLKDLYTFVMGSGPYCEGTLEAREKEFEAMWQRISTTTGARTGNRRSSGDDFKSSLMRCYMSCSGGLIDKYNDESEEKHRACSEAVHWAPILFSKGDETVDSCHFYPQKSPDLQLSACFWGNCIDTADLHASVWPSWGLSLDRAIDATMFRKNMTVKETMFDEVLNPSPMHSALQETYAMHCGGKATVWVSHPGEITAMRNTLRALMGYNTRISHVEFQITSEAKEFDIVDSIEGMRDDWQVSLCRSHSREFLAPFVVVLEGDSMKGKNVADDEPSSADACSVNKDCGSCTAHADNRDLAKKCNWCPLTKSCHDYLSTPGTCGRHEVYTENKYCECNAGFAGRVGFAKASSGSANSVCSWLTTKSGELPANSDDWKGGDFLAPAYTKAATCVCTGAGSDLWSSDVAACVRNEFIEGHKQIQPALKLATRAKQGDYDPATWQSVLVPPSIIGALWEVQKNAYAACGCPGGVADFPTWSSEFYTNVGGANFDGCAATNIKQLSMNRCGCGF